MRMGVYITSFAACFEQSNPFSCLGFLSLLPQVHLQLSLVHSLKSFHESYKSLFTE